MWSHCCSVVVAVGGRPDNLTFFLVFVEARVYVGLWAVLGDGVSD